MKSIFMAAVFSLLGLGAIAQTSTKNTKTTATKSAVKPGATKGKTTATKSKAATAPKKETTAKEEKAVNLSAMLKTDSTVAAKPDSVLVPKEQ